MPASDLTLSLGMRLKGLQSGLCDFFVAALVDIVVRFLNVRVGHDERKLGEDSFVDSADPPGKNSAMNSSNVRVVLLRCGMVSGVWLVVVKDFLLVEVTCEALEHVAWRFERVGRTCGEWGLDGESSQAQRPRGVRVVISGILATTRRYCSHVFLATEDGEADHDRIKQQ